MKINIYDEVGKRKRLFFSDSGVKLRERIVKKIYAEKAHDLVILNFADIEVVDVSFAREGFVKLISMLSTDEPHPQLLFLNVNDYVKQNLDLSMKEHKKFALTADNKKNWELIGKCSEQIRETVCALIKLKETTAKRLSKELNIELTTCNNRLMSLYEMCVITRMQTGQKSGGIEFIYKLVI